MKLFLVFCALQVIAQDPLIGQRDWKRAVWRSPLHIALSAPIAATSLIIPPVGEKYVRWRTKAERQDEQAKRDTAFKAEIDLYSQTALVKAVLRIYGIKE